MNNLAAIFAAVVAVLYFVRMIPLRFIRHGWTFVLAHCVGGAGCILAFHELITNDVTATSVWVPLMAAIYLIRSKGSFFEVTTDFGELGPSPLDLDALRNVTGGHK